MTETHALDAARSEGAGKAGPKSELLDDAQVGRRRHVTSGPLIQRGSASELKAVIAPPAISVVGADDAGVSASENEAAVHRRGGQRHRGAAMLGITALSAAELRVEILAETNELFAVAQAGMGSPCAHRIREAHLFKRDVRASLRMPELAHGVVAAAPQR